MILSCGRWPTQVFCFIVSLIFCFPLSSGATTTYCLNLQKKAERLGLWQSRQWHALLHMPLQGSGKSRIDSAEFFLSHDGKSNPAAEGAATLRSFFQQPGPEQKDSHPQCLYPARYQWLKNQLSFDTDLLPEQVCPQLSQWMADLDPAGITLVFPESYINNPASMFGHTLLRIEQRASRSALLAPSINFSAITEEKPGILYAVKGLFGGYSGKFSKGLYVDQVRSYGALENRDIYEYTLGLSDSETRFLLLHVYELKRATFDYFFFDENCSYQLLSLLEVGRPSLDLTGHIHVASIPVDTIRQVVSLPGMLRQVNYRASLRRGLTRKIARFSSQQLKLVAELADKGRAGNVPRCLFDDKTLQAAVLDAAIDLVLYNQAAATGKNDAKDPLLLQLLQARSLLPAGTRPINNNMPAVRPDQGHGTARFTFGSGVDHGDYFFDAEFRPVLHDLMDPGPGYVDGAEVEFFSPALRFYPDKKQLVLQQLKLLDIVSLAPGDKLIKPISWLVYIGMDQRRYTEAGDRLTGRAKAGFGITTQLPDGLEGYCLLTGQLVINSHFQYGLNAAPGIVGGVRTTGHERWNSVFQVESGYSLLPDTAWSWSLKFMQSLHITRNFSLRMGVARKREFAAPSTETSFSLHWYF
jgi:hypothetical protein